MKRFITAVCLAILSTAFTGCSLLIFFKWIRLSRERWVVLQVENLAKFEMKMLHPKGPDGRPLVAKAYDF